MTLLDTAALLEKVRLAVPDKVKLLRDSWRVSDVTEPVGAFRLRFVVEREKSPLDVPGAGLSSGAFRCGVTSWVAEPVTEQRGETAAQARLIGSAFRKVVDRVDPQLTKVTLWVYPDSKALFETLRDYLHDKGVKVAHRPLPDTTPIAASRNGAVSRGE